MNYCDNFDIGKIHENFNLEIWCYDRELNLTLKVTSINSFSAEIETGIP